MIKHLLFDLDGTLLPIDLDFFFQDYLSALSARFATTIKPPVFQEKLLASTMAMVKSDDPNLTNEEVFGKTSRPGSGCPGPIWSRSSATSMTMSTVPSATTCHQLARYVPF